MKSGSEIFKGSAKQLILKEQKAVPQIEENKKYSDNCLPMNHEGVAVRSNLSSNN